MWTGILLTTTIICALGWWIEHMALKALKHYVVKKGYEKPNDEEIKEMTEFAFKKKIN